MLISTPLLPTYSLTSLCRENCLPSLTTNPPHFRFKSIFVSTPHICNLAVISLRSLNKVSWLAVLRKLVKKMQKKNNGTIERNRLTAASRKETKDEENNTETWRRNMCALSRNKPCLIFFPTCHKQQQLTATLKGCTTFLCSLVGRLLNMCVDGRWHHLSAQL